jgi:hypothetical protein
MQKKAFFWMLILTLVFVGGFFASKAQAGPGNNVSRWMWGGSESSNDGTINGNETGVGWISLNNTNTGGAVDYGVTIPNWDGNVIGYGWSENLGWIDFNPQNHCTTGVPGAGQYQATSCTSPGGGNGGVTKSGNSLQGWARIVSVAQASIFGNNGGWQGWMHLNDASLYGVDITKMDGTGNNPTYAWSGETDIGGVKYGLGFIDFSRALATPCVPDGTTFENPTCIDGAACGACGAVETTNPWMCAGTDNCGGTITGAQSDCLGTCTGTDTICPACPPPASGNWKEVAP